MPNFSPPDPGSPWFLVWFAVMWLTVSALLSLFSGWLTLGEKFRSREEVDGERFRFISGAMGFRWIPVSYSSCLFLTVAPTGLRLSLLFLFRLLSPPLFIPWDDVESVTERRFLFMRSAAIRVVGHWPEVRIYGRAGQCVLEMHARRAGRSAP